ncbi:hypothetical protein ACJRO7_020719 [Eucalyptus globulus]|uniref:Uncharacterized protein n=1 Tax=Eucalyptus globulus TaxID=34317 RepID=A0ABD3KJ18_EUCGL
MERRWLVKDGAANSERERGELAAASVGISCGRLAIAGLKHEAEKSCFGQRWGFDGRRLTQVGLKTQTCGRSCWRLIERVAAWIDSMLLDFDGVRCGRFFQWGTGDGGTGAGMEW